MNSIRRLLPFFPLVWLTASAHCLAASGIEGMRSTDTVHGLYEIREAAREFITRENARTHGTWEATEPNLKVLVPRCAVPLTARWDTIRWFANTKGGELSERSRRVISVVCTRAVSPSQKWDVHVPVTQQRSQAARP
ncbi:hypothetical protein ACSFBM_19510 [Variovorax sp. GB1R11]|uniref:hypothetical protein n=1 Tax=Variovorax sp. GB1R11 TaxID=3443741 RepID=UPI003F48486A